MKVNKKTKSIIFCSTALLGISLCSSIFNISSGQESSRDSKIVNPIINYVSLYVPQDKLNETTPSGHSLSSVFMKSICDYKEGVKPFYIDGVLIANKQYALPSSFSGSELSQEANEQLEKLYSAASAEGITLKAFSIYRSYDKQVELYSRYVARDGQAAADRYSARPGFSEHQTALAFDIGGLDSSKWASVSFNGTREAEWLKENAYKYGFILRYPENKEDITGYMHESWHYRYVGVEKSEPIHKSGLTLEEFYGLDKVKELKEFLPAV